MSKKELHLSSDVTMQVPVLNILQRFLLLLLAYFLTYSWASKGREKGREKKGDREQVGQERETGMEVEVRSRREGGQEQAYRPKTQDGGQGLVVAGSLRFLAGSTR